MTTHPVNPPALLTFGHSGAENHWMVSHYMQNAWSVTLKKTNLSHRKSVHAEETFMTPLVAAVHRNKFHMGIAFHGQETSVTSTETATVARRSGRYAYSFWDNRATIFEAYRQTANMPRSTNTVHWHYHLQWSGTDWQATGQTQDTHTHTYETWSRRTRCHEAATGWRHTWSHCATQQCNIKVNY